MEHATAPKPHQSSSALDRKEAQLRNTLIENAPQVSIRRAAPQAPTAKPGITSPMSDDFPTPRAVPPSAGTASSFYRPVEDVPASPASSDTQSDGSSMWSKRSSKSEFDEMYDLSGSESEDFPIKLSSSVKRRVAAPPKTARYPSLVIPSPSQWPTIQKFKSGSTPLSPGHQVMLSPAALAHFHDRSLRVPSTTSAPSLDGSMTSEELALSSCPSTPDIAMQQAENAWEAPIQLDPSAISLLHQINGEEEQSHLETVIEVPEEAVSEMREIVESPGFGMQIKTDGQTLEPRSASVADDELSALSVPSPGGFFSSLDSSLARRTWSGGDAPLATSTATEFYGVPFKSPQSGLHTSTAASFYGVPWASRPENAIEHNVAVASPLSEKQDPVTARRGTFSPTEVISEVDEIDETYDDTLKQTAAANIDRTQLWLSTQKAYIENLCSEDEVIESFKDVDGAVPKTPERPTATFSDSSPQSKKSVRFADDFPVVEEKAKKRISPIHDGTFWAGFKHTKRSQRARDVFQHRQMRAEAEHVRRNSAGKQHAEQLQGKFELTLTERPAPARPVSSFLPTAAEDEKKEIIARAERERQALEQIQPSAWHLSAQKEIHGGSLLTSPIVASFKNRTDVRVLDLFGQVHCSWAWDVALSHPQAQVYTTVSSDAEAHVSSLAGPDNHDVVAAPKPWNLPFPSSHFDVVSARNLYTHLKTIVPHGEVSDEWDLTLQECQRVLKPGGYLEFDLLDAELVHPDSALQALGVEFAFKLRTRGYDPASGKNFLPRLKRAGFQDIKRAWMVLPVADVAPRWTDAGKATTSSSSGSSASTIVPREEYFPSTPERTIGPNGSVTDVSVYEPPVTGSTRDVRAITGLVGGRAWEQWMLKLSAEMGRGEQGLDGIGKALEEAGRGNAGWRCLVGWARKGM